MGGARAAYATAAPGVRSSGPSTGNDLKPVSRGSTHTPVDDDNQVDDGDGGYDSGSGPWAGVHHRPTQHQHIDSDADDYDNDDDDYENEAYAAEELREQELVRLREEMRARFNFPVEKRRSLQGQWINAMRRKRRLLMRNENLRFRELYRPPEPMVVVTVISIVTIVTLILTKSWPFY